MTDRLETLLREVVDDLAAGANTISDRDRRRLAINAADRGYTLRQRQRGALIGAVATVTALALIVPYALILRRDPGPRVQPGQQPTLPANVPLAPDGVQTHVITDTTKPIGLVDGWYVMGNRMVLDRARNTYSAFAGQSVLPSPNGLWVATVSGSLSGYRVTRLSTGTGRRYDVETNGWDPQWSPDGNRLLSGSPRPGNPSVLIATVVDVTTGTSTQTTIDISDLACVRCQLDWMPSGEEIGLTLSHKLPGTEQPVATGIQTFTLDGHRSRSLPIAADPLGTGAWSPDGRYVIGSGMAADGSTPEGQLIDVVSGAIVRRLSNRYPRQVSWLDDGRYLIWELIRPDRADSQDWLLMVSLERSDGTVLERWIPPLGIVDYLGGFPLPPLAAHLG